MELGPLKTCAGFSEIMGTLARMGYFNTEAHPSLKHEKRPTFEAFLLELLRAKSKSTDGTIMREADIAERISELGLCKDSGSAVKTAKTIM